MEYYESRKSDKHVVFLSKLQTLLLKPNVVEAMAENVDSKKSFEVKQTWVIHEFHWVRNNWLKIKKRK